MSSASAFSQHFSIVPALDDASRDAGYRIRHQVYCEDLHYEPLRPDQRERDEFDSQAIACLLRYRQDGEFIGVARVVVPAPGRANDLLPFEITCGSHLYRGPLDPRGLPRNRVAEVSRLAVIRRFRRRKEESASALPISEGDFGSLQQPRFPYIPVGLYLGAIAIAKQLDLTTLFTLTEPRLARHFARFGVDVVQIGEPVEHRGLRIPSMISIPDVLEHMSPSIRPMWRDVESEVRTAWALRAGRLSKETG